MLITLLVGKKSRAEIFLKSQYICLLRIIQKSCFNLDEEENKMNLLCILFTHTLFLRMNGKTRTFTTTVLVAYISNGWERFGS